MFDQFYDDTDALIKSDAELLGHLFFQGLTDAGPYLAGATSFLSGAIGFGTGLVLATVPFAELLLADSVQESREIFWMAIINAAIDYKLDFAIKPTIKKFIKSGVPFLSNSFKALKKTAKLFDPSDLKTTKLKSLLHVTQELTLIGKTKYKTAKILSTKFTTPRYDKDMNLISTKGDAISTALSIAHPSAIYNSPFMGAKGDLVMFICTPPATLENDEDEHEVKHVMVCVGDGLFSGVGNDSLDPTLSSEKQLFTAEDLIKIRDRGLHNSDDVSNTIPLTIKVLRLEDEEIEPERPSIIHIPDKQYDGKFGDRALWANGTAFEKLGSQQGTNRLTIKNSANETIIVSCIKSGTSTRWRMEWSSELLSKSDTTAIESDTLNDILPQFNDLLDKCAVGCAVNLFSYQVILGNEFEESGFMKTSIANSVAFDRSPQSLDAPLPDTNGYWDKTLTDMSKEQFNNVFRNYVNEQKITGSFNASDFFNFLISLHQGDNPDCEPENISSIEDVRDNYAKLISSRAIAGFLNQLLLSAGYRPPEGVEGSPFSKQSLSAFLGMLVNNISSEENIELEHDNLSAESFNAEHIGEDMNDMTLNQGFSGVFSGWLLPILYKNKKVF